MVLTSKIAAIEDSAGKISQNNGNEMLSTDETEVRQHIEIIEQTV